MSRSDFKNGKVLITGGAGYVGCRLALMLHGKGYRVTVVDKVTPKERGITFPAAIEFKHGDLRDAHTAKEAVSGIDTIVHLAANIGSLTYMHNHQAEILQENSAIDATLYPAAVEACVKRIIYSSSSMVFQRAPKFPYVEKDLSEVLLPTNVYGMSKLVGEYFCCAYFEQFKLPYVILRYHNIYGPGEDSKGESPGDVHVIPALIEKVVGGQYPLEILGDLHATRPFTYVDDAVLATFMIFEKAFADDPNVINNDFNIGPREATKILNLAQLIWELLGDGRPFQYITKDTKAITAIRREVDPRKISSVIGWQPKVSLQDGILKTAEWIKSRKDKPRSVLN